MAKKTRKVLKQESQQRAIQQAATNVNTALTAAAAQAVTADRPAVAARPARTGENNNSAEDFRYVKSDLRRIGILAVSFSAILVVLSFFIH
jgi:predicted flap endonuclease-1-like 5' DNA nuclease